MARSSVPSLYSPSSASIVLPLLLAGERFCIYISHRCSSVCTQQIKEKAKEKCRYAVHPTVHINRSLPTCVLSKALRKVGNVKLPRSYYWWLDWSQTEGTPFGGGGKHADRWYVYPAGRYKFGKLLCTIHALQTDWCETRTHQPQCILPAEVLRWVHGTGGSSDATSAQCTPNLRWGLQRKAACPCDPFPWPWDEKRRCMCQLHGPSLYKYNCYFLHTGE